MSLVYGVFCMSLAVVAFGIIMIGARNPARPFWATNFIVANLYVTGMVILALVGLGLVGKAIGAWSQLSFGPMEAVLAVFGVLFGPTGWKLLKVRTRIEAYSRLAGSPQAIERQGSNGARDMNRPPKPRRRETRRQKAA